MKNVEDDKNIMLLLKKLNLGIEAVINSQVTPKELTASQCRLLGYLGDHRDENLCSTDIHTRLRYSRATVSEMLKRLRQKGFISFEADPADDRLKYIRLTAKAYEMERFMDRTFADVRERLYQGFTSEEQDEFLRLVRKMLGNLYQTGESNCPDSIC